MSENHSGPGRDMRAAYAGLIGGALFIGAILYTIVLLTNKHFDNEKAGEKKTSQLAQPAASVRSAQA